MTDPSAATSFVYSTYGGDPDLAELVDAFVAELPGRVEAIIDFAQRDQWNMVSRLAHQLKGAAGSYGFQQLTPAAGRVESTVNEQAQHADIWTTINELLALSERVRVGTPGLPDISN